MKLSLIVTLYLFAAYQYCFAQNNSDGYEVKIKNGQYSCTSNSIFKGSSGKGDNIYEVMFDMYKSTKPTDSRLLLAIRLSTVGDTELVSIARLHQSGNSVTKQAKIVLTNGYSFFEDVMITDISNLKNSKEVGAFYFFFKCNDPVERITMLRQHDIKTITIGGHVINMQRTTAKSAEIINKLCSKLIQTTGNHSSYGSGPSTSSHAAPTSSKDKKPIELVYFPLGVINSDVSGLTLADAARIAKQKLNVDINTLDTSFSVYDFCGYDITLYRKSLCAVFMILSDGRKRWDYSIDFSRAEYKRNDVVNFAKRIVADIQSNGFKSMAATSFENYPFIQVMTKDSYHVEIQVLDDSQYDKMRININVSPNGSL